MEGAKFFFIRKTIPGMVIFQLRSINNQDRTHMVILTEEQPMARVPADMALWIFYNSEVFKMFENKCFTVENYEALTKLAIEEGLYFEDELTFTPASKNHEEEIAKILKEGAKIKVKELLQKESPEVVVNVARENLDQLTSGTIKYLEEQTQTQLLIDEE